MASGYLNFLLQGITALLFLLKWSGAANENICFSGLKNLHFPAFTREVLPAVVDTECPKKSNKTQKYWLQMIRPSGKSGIVASNDFSRRYFSVSNQPKINYSPWRASFCIFSVIVWVWVVLESFPVEAGPLLVGATFRQYFSETFGSKNKFSIFIR